MYVVATAGHVDHGKSTLVRALTGTDPDRFAEEKRRGLTIDLGFAWTTLDPDAATLAFVDVPGHERFIATMLAGLGPAPAVLFVVAADEGWRRQSGEHLAAVDALGLTHGLLAVTRADLADPGPVLAEAGEHLARSSLGTVRAVAVSAVTGAGLGELRSALRDLVRRTPAPQTTGRVRLWVDRSFTLAGTGTVVTGTLGRGGLTVGDELQVADDAGRRVRVRGLHTLQEARDQVAAVARVGVNLRGAEPRDIVRGHALLTPDAWPLTALVDVRLHAGDRAEDLPAELVAHVGTAAVPVRVRALGGSTARLTLVRRLPLEPGDRLVLRDPGRQAVAAGAIVLDSAPPPLQRRGAAARRAEDLARLAGAGSAVVLAEQVARRRAVRREELATWGVPLDDTSRVHVQGDWLIDPDAWRSWVATLLATVEQRAREDPLDPRLSDAAACHRLGLPDHTLLPAVVEAAGLVHADGRISHPAAVQAGLGAQVESALARLHDHLVATPFAAPERGRLDDWGLGLRELAAAERLGRIVRLTPEIVLLPRAPAAAMRILATLPQPFTTSEARQALRTTRRVVIPLLEHLDRRGWTLREDAGHRRVRGT